MAVVDHLTLRQKLTWLAHFWKAASQQHHRELIPFFGEVLPSDGVVIDVGTHSGQFAKLFASLVPNGHVHAFEPSSYALSIVRKVIKAKRVKNVTLYGYGLGDADFSAQLNIPIKKSGSLGFGLSYLGDAENETRPLAVETIKIRRLDDVVAETGITRIDLIKADIEGSELRMLRGAEDTIAMHRPAIYLEVSDETLSRQGNNSDELKGFLRSYDYAPKGGWHAGRITGDVLFLAQPQ